MFEKIIVEKKNGCKKNNDDVKTPTPNFKLKFEYIDF